MGFKISGIHLELHDFRVLNTLVVSGFHYAAQSGRAKYSCPGMGSVGTLNPKVVIATVLCAKLARQFSSVLKRDC